MRGMDTRQGAHQVAQKSTTVTRPFAIEARPFPSRSGSEIASGPAAVGAGGTRPRPMATATTAAAASATNPHRNRSTVREGAGGMGPLTMRAAHSGVNRFEKPAALRAHGGVCLLRAVHPLAGPAVPVRQGPPNSVAALEMLRRLE